MIELEYISCPFCNSKNSSNLLTGKDYLFSQNEFAVVQCESCRLIFTNPRIKKSRIADYYFPDYIQHGEIKQLSIFQRAGNYLGHLFGSPHKKILRLLENNNVKKVLEVGAGSGDLLNILKDKGFQVAGVETDTECVKRIREMNIVCHFGDITDLVSEIGSNKYDAVVFQHAFEHLHSPRETLRTAYKLLKENGTLFISLPNIGSIEAKLFGKYWKGLDLPRHIVHYDVDSIEKMISDANFEIVNIEDDNFPSSFVESIGFFLCKRRMSSVMHLLLYYPWKLLSPIHMRLIGSGVMSVTAIKH